MSKDNYQNFIYLFNNTNNVSLLRLNSSNRKIVNTFAQSEDSLNSLSQKEFDNYQVFSSDSTVNDFPIEQISSLRLQQNNTFTNFIRASDTSDLQTDIVINSNDPGLDPNFISFFEINNVIPGISSKVSFDSKNVATFHAGSSTNKPHYIFRLGSSDSTVDVTNLGTKYVDYIELTSTSTAIQVQENLTPIPNEKSFLFRHIKPLDLKNYLEESATGAKLSDKVNNFFQTAYLTAVNNSLQLGNKNVNLSCKIGVPYDFKTLLNEKINEKGLGISIKQPNYEKIYNYYDPQYEPIAIKSINTFLLDEKSLPSIYDFIFLKSQKNELRPIIGLPGFGVDPDRVNIANINQYLDKFATLYARFIKRGGKQQTLEELVANRIVPSVAPQSLFMLDPNVPVSQYNENSPVNQLPSKIQKQIKSCATKALKSVIIDHLPIVEDKKEKLPKWIDSIKTGIYFKENSLNLFNNTLDKDDAFPFLIKINIPVEKKGPISNLFSEFGFLDNINSYAASINIPTDETNQQGEFFVSDYDTFSGGIINGFNNTNYNLFSKVEFPSFKIFLRDAPKPPVEKIPKVSSDNTSPSTIKTQKKGVEATVLTEAFNIPGVKNNENELENINENELENIDVLNPIESSTDIYLNSFEAIGDKAFNNVFIYNEDKKNTLPTPISFLIEKLKLEKFKEKLRFLMLNEKLFRTPTEIHQGKMAYQETMMYEITKYKINALGDQQYVQSIFLPICNQSNLSYYDTQVIPYQDYFYKIYAYKMIVGTDYAMTPFSKDRMVNFNKNNGRIGLAYNVEPFIQVVRVPYYNARHVNIKEDKLNHSRIEDAPPLAPQVDFVPFRNVENKLMILFNNSIGETIQYPKVILSDDKKMFEDVYLAQDRKPGSELLFKSDDSLGTFQIFRTDNLPEYYRSVNEDDSLKFVQIEQPTDINNSMNTSFVDNILPNKHYYYFFRFLDIHGKVSNPSIVYKVMMKKEKNMTPYLQIDIVDLSEQRQKQYDDHFTSTKALQKYLFVDLAESQKQPDYENVEVDFEEDVDDPSYYGSYSSVKVNFNNSGLNTQSAFGKRFKFRLTSKQTGKKIDVNLKVKQPEVKLNN